MKKRRRTYLDMAAGVLGNPSSPYAEGRAAKDTLETARSAIAKLLEVQADDVIVTSGATESNALAILGAVRARRRMAGVDTPGRNHLHVLYLPSSHASVVENIKLLSEEGVRVEPLPVRDYRVDTDALRKMLREETMLVSMDAVCAETGVVWNTREVADVLKNTKREKKQSMRPESSKEPKKRLLTPLLHVDASQAPLTEKITRDHFGADLVTFDGAKVAPVRGVGVLVVHRTIPLEPLYRGGGQERGVRPGTGNPEGAAAVAHALGKTVARREKYTARALAMRTRFIENVTRVLPDVYVQEGKTQAPNIVSLSLVGRDTDYLVALLDEAGFAVATKSACETDAEHGSRAVQVLTGDADRARSTLRISWGHQTSPRALKRFTRALIHEVQFIDSVART